MNTSGLNRDIRSLVYCFQAMMKGGYAEKCTEESLVSDVKRLYLKKATQFLEVREELPFPLNRHEKVVLKSALLDLTLEFSKYSGEVCFRSAEELYKELWKQKVVYDPLDRGRKL